MLHAFKKIGVRVSLVLLRFLLSTKRKSVALFILLRHVLQWLFVLVGGQRLLLALARHRHVFQMTPPPSLTFRRSFLSIVLLVLGGALLAQFVRTPRGESLSSFSPGSGETIEQQEFTGRGGPDFGQTNVLDIVSVLPGLETPEEERAIVEGSALVSPSINVTRLENRLRESIETYIVQEGDTVSTIAEKFGISTNTILWENKLSARTTIRPGQTLSILPTSGIAHTVKKGETLKSIAKKYKVDEREILEFNEIDDPARIAVSLKLIVPEASPLPVPVPRAPRVTTPSAPPPGQNVRGALGMIVPVRYRRVSQWFTWRHSGVDLATPYGTPIWASDDGVVVQAGWGNGYGLFVLIDHGNGLVTRYAHNSKNYVKRGDRVAKGQTIALIGSTGRSTGPHVHFEIIQNGRFVNPTQYLKF